MAARRGSPISFSSSPTIWLDTSLYGSKYYETPNIERLARRGMMFTQAYAAAPICSPTRASIMTGQFLGMTLPSAHLPEVLQ